MNSSCEDSNEKRSGKERRENGERRQKTTESAEYTGPDRRASVVDRRLGLDRRRGPGRRRTDHRKAAEEGTMSDEQFEFVMAIDEYKKKNNRPFPTWTEVLELVKALGYRKVEEPMSLADIGKNIEINY